jgi:outer membrane protein OmpA-like peptidoglycan-associated protein
MVVAVLCSASATAQEVKSLRGKPSSDMILEALSPAASPAANAAAPDAPAAAPAVPARRRRGLSLNPDQMAAPAPAVIPAEPAPVAAVPAQAAPVQAAPAQAAMAPVAVSAPAPQVVQQPQLRALDLDIQFRFGSDDLTNDGKDVLDQLAMALKSDRLAGARMVILEGHADAKGNPVYNQALSLKRAQSARNYLAGRHGIAPGKLFAVGKGSSEPADPKNPESEINRRVRVILEI